MRKTSPHRNAKQASQKIFENWGGWHDTCSRQCERCPGLKKICAEVVDGSATPLYSLPMITTTIRDGRLIRFGVKAWIVREIAGVKVEISVGEYHEGDGVLDVSVGFTHSGLTSSEITEIHNEIERDRDNLLAIFGY